MPEGDRCDQERAGFAGPRDAAIKGGIAAELNESVWPLLSAGVLKVMVDSTFALEDASDAHRRMESSEHVGKIVLATAAAST